MVLTGEIQSERNTVQVPDRFGFVLEYSLASM
jgi:hypothetical protein